MAKAGGALKRGWGRLWTDEDLTGHHTDRSVLADGRHRARFELVASRFSARGARREVEDVARRLGLECEIGPPEGWLFITMPVAVCGAEQQVDECLGWVNVWMANGHMPAGS